MILERDLPLPPQSIVVARGECIDAARIVATTIELHRALAAACTVTLAFTAIPQGDWRYPPTVTSILCGHLFGIGGCVSHVTEKNMHVL